jgi:DNA mismatch endonuclease (patch repair protein)
MADVFSSDDRSRIMASIRGRDTAPELLIRKIVHRLGFRFRLHRRDLPGTPDIVFPRLHKIIFVHGCFWHMHRGCRRAGLPRTNRTFWKSKISRNANRDRVDQQRLRKLGWDVLVVWQCDTKETTTLERRLRKFLYAVPSGANEK